MSDQSRDAATREARAEVFHEYRPLLRSIAYRMLGSLADAEDILQDAYIRWQESTTAARNPRAFLVTTVSRLCINHLESARVRREEYVGSWLPEPVAADDSLERAGADDSLSIAFLVLLERLTPTERAVFLLREVFEYEYSEIGAILDQTEPACRQILRRARLHVAENRPRFASSPEQRATLLQQFVRASASGDLAGLVALLHEDVVLYTDGGGKTAAVPRPIHGADNVARFFLRAPRRFLPADVVRRFADVNGQPAIVTYLDGRPHSVFTVELQAGAIRQIFIIANPEKLSHLPELPDPPS